ncbi:DUF2877 domain-containing protein [Nocardioides iriomotensis]|uniref:DUF2877 domain-containing protein n=1 Tax=Nocardioides iriomotensis TaxID=715784 RepID=A0A4Q5J0P5_9ACTN|nr:DUF2877 domain-containing protein [Nocardioides iriomotensis]RYU11178.1 DUF2877 domain-containing protein [Nocardioides iriomotensis]
MGAFLPCAASSLVSGVLGSADRWVEAARTRVSVHLETGSPDVPIVCVGLPEAIRLPYGVVVEALPDGPVSLAPRRWWRPDRPAGLAPPAPARIARWTRPLPPPDPARLLGRGAGLTPDGDDVLAGLLVAAAAVDDPRLGEWRAATRSALAARRTTAVSVGMLHAALDGWSAPPLAGAVRALCGPDDPTPAVDALLAVGQSSGRSLLDGVLYVLASQPWEGAA